MSRLVQRGGVLGVVAAVATALVLVGSVQGGGESLARAAARAWHAVFGDRPQPPFGRRVIVVLASPSLANRVAAADDVPSAEEQRRWTAQVEAGQDLLVAGLRGRGLEIEREFVFSRTLNGFSAVVDPRAVAELERHPGVVGIYPLRTVYPASVSADALLQPDFQAGAGRRPEVALPGFDGSGVRIALLDTGVDRDHPFLSGRVLPGFDTVARDRLAAAEPSPSDPARLESHGTRMAGLIVGAGGPAGLAGIAPGAELLPIRVLGWQETAEGSSAILGRGDQLLAGFERAVDPDGDGDVEDAVDIALAPVVEPFAAFVDSPEARAVAGVTALGTLVVAPSGNDGRAGIGFGAVAAPAAAPEALAVGALDTRRELLEVDADLRAGDDGLLTEPVRVLGAVAPRQTSSLPVTSLLGPTLADPGRAAATEADGAELADFFDTQGVSLVAGRAVLLPADGSSSLEVKARNAAAGGTAALLVYGSDLPAGSLDLDDAAALPVLAVPAEAGRTAAEALRAGEAVSIGLGAARAVANAGHLQVAPFSSGGLAFDGRVRPDLVAPGVGLATADAGVGFDGTPRYATTSGSSAAAAVAAGAAALVAQARPDLNTAELRSVLVGNASRLEPEGASPPPVTEQGAGAIDPTPAAAAELAVEPTTLAFGRADAAGWSAPRTVTVRNLSSRPLEVGFGFAPDQDGEPAVAFAVEPARLSLGPGASAEVAVTASATTALGEGASGVFVVAADGTRPVRLPWAVAARPGDGQPLVDSVRLSNWQFKPSQTAPVVLAFRAGRVSSAAEGERIEPVGLLDVELWTPEGERLGVIARLRDLLPGRYAFGLTGRGPEGKVLAPGTYVVRLRAQPVDAAEGATPPAAETVFRITP